MVPPEIKGYLTLAPGLLDRPLVWQELFMRVPERLLFGFGLMNVTFFLGSSPHNLYLAQVAYFGVIGTILFLVVLLSFAFLSADRLTRSHSWADVALLFLVAGTLLQGGVEYVIAYPTFFANSMFWLTVGLLASDDQ